MLTIAIALFFTAAMLLALGISGREIAGRIDQILDLLDAHAAMKARDSLGPSPVYRVAPVRSASVSTIARPAPLPPQASAPPVRFPSSQPLRAAA